jgi:GNAT superfamily N-acetyltransferase
MQLIEVTDKKLEKEFIQVNVQLNKKDPNYIRPLDKDVLDVFNPVKNKAFRFGKVIRWILKNDKGELIGRIAAFTNKKYRNKGDEVPVGGIGFFDCINDQNAADTLFDVSKHWLMQQGMEAMDGPINFGERDRWWGLLVEGFQPPVYCLNYNPPYYKDLFETYGFKLFFNQLCYGIDPKKKIGDKIYERHDRVAQDPGFSSDNMKKNNLDKYAVDFTKVYNEAWAGHGGLKQLDLKVVKKMLKSMKPVMDEKINWFAYYKDRPIGMFINLPDLNQWFKYLNGKFDLWHKLKFLYIKKTKPCKKFVGLVFGVVPEYQGKGVDSYLIIETANTTQPHTAYTEYEMQWIGDFNPKMINVAENFGETFKTRTLTTYRYLFDRTREFKRHPILN